MTLDVDEWLTSRPDRFTPDKGQEAEGAPEPGRSVSRSFHEDRIFCPCRNLNPEPPTCSLVAILAALNRLLLNMCTRICIKIQRENKSLCIDR